MNPNSSKGQRWLRVALYAIAMAWGEAAVVYYLRTHIDRLEPYQVNPLPVVGGFAPVELAREAATLVMLWTVGWLAGLTGRSRFGYMAVAFGIWDIFYYVFLKIMTGWPGSLADWDVLFLLPLPWWGPVWAPTAISLLMICWGSVVTQFEPPAGAGGASRRSLALGCLGAVLALFVFMSDAIRTADQGVDALRNMLPVWFNWPLFSIALGLMVVPVLETARETFLSERCSLFQSDAK